MKILVKSPMFGLSLDQSAFRLVLATKERSGKVSDFVSWRQYFTEGMRAELVGSPYLEYGRYMNLWADNDPADCYPTALEGYLKRLAEVQSLFPFASLEWQMVAQRWDAENAEQHGVPVFLAGKVGV